MQKSCSNIEMAGVAQTFMVAIREFALCNVNDLLLWEDFVDQVSVCVPPYCLPVRSSFISSVLGLGLPL